MYFAKKQDLKKAEKAAEKENFSQLSGISIGDLKIDIAPAEEDYKEAKKAVEEAKASLASLDCLQRQRPILAPLLPIRNHRLGT